jgi:uncharacterized membrane protein
MRTRWQLSHMRLGMLYVAAMLLGGHLVLLCWRLSEGQTIWGPVLGVVSMLCTSCSVLLLAKSGCTVD